MLGVTHDGDQLDLYWACRWAFLDRPDARLSTDRDEFGRVWVFVDERFKNGYQIRGNYNWQPWASYLDSRESRVLCRAVARQLRDRFGEQVEAALSSWVPWTPPERWCGHVHFQGGSLHGKVHWLDRAEWNYVAMPDRPITYWEAPELPGPETITDQLEYYTLGKLGNGTPVYRLNGWEG